MKEEPSPHRLDFWKQMLHSTWQIIAVGAGAPVGKEGAPREIGALLAPPLGRVLDLSFQDRIFSDRLRGWRRLGSGLPSATNQCLFYL